MDGLLAQFCLPTPFLMPKCSVAPCVSYAPLVSLHPSGPSQAETRRVLLFNCMKERDPAVLLPALSRSLAARGIAFHQALFVPPDSQYGFLPAAGAAGGGTTHPSAASAPPPPDLSWQAGMQQLWEKQGLGASSSPAIAAAGKILPTFPLPVLTTSLGDNQTWLRS